MGIYLDSIGVKDVAFPMLFSAMLGGIVSAIGMEHWIKDTEKIIEEYVKRRSILQAGKLERFWRRVSTKPAVLTMSMISVWTPILIGMMVIIAILSLIAGSTEGILLSAVLIPFLAWSHLRTKKELRKLRKLLV